MSLEKPIVNYSGELGIMKTIDFINPICRGQANSQQTPSNPASTQNTTGVMSGLSGSITPTCSGVVSINICGGITNTSISGGANIQIRFGTGTAPSNGAALIGTAAGVLIHTTQNALGTGIYPFSIHAIISGLILGTTYWIDISLASKSAGTTSSITDICINANEL